MMRHLALTFRGFRTAARGDQPYKTRCGMHLRGLGLTPADAPLCPICVRARSGASNSFDLKIENVTSDVEGDDEPMAPGKLSVDQAIERARMVSTGGLLSQTAYQAIANRLEPSDRYPFDMELVARQIRVRTGAVNIVDREEPGAGEPPHGGDSNLDMSPIDVQVGKTPASGEENDSIGGTLEFNYSGPRRSEGEVQQATPAGHDLGDLVLARAAQLYAEDAGFSISLEDMQRLLLEGVGLEYSQQLRYQTYAETLRVAFRTPLADEFKEHAENEAEHAGFLLKRAILLGAKPEFRVEQPLFVDATDPDALAKILEELWKREQAGIEYYLELRDACGTSAMRHSIEEILVKELEHTDDLLRLGHRMHREGALEIPGPSYPFRSEPARWNESYSNENAFEGLDKMGNEVCTCGAPMPGPEHMCLTCGKPCEGSQPKTAALARVGENLCPGCGCLGTRWVEACLLCTGKTALVASPVCQACQGVREVVRCACRAVHTATRPFLTKQRREAWLKKADAVKRITRCGEIPVHLEYEKGDTREGVGPDGPWQRPMHAGYGYIPGTEGADGEPLDVYLGSHPSRQVYVVNQLKPDGAFDEEKVMLGFSSPETAEAVYRAHYPKNGEKHFGGLQPMSMDAFVAEYVEPDRPDAYQPTMGLAHVPLLPKEAAEPAGTWCEHCKVKHKPSTECPYKGIRAKQEKEDSAVNDFMGAVGGLEGQVPVPFSKKNFHFFMKNKGIEPDRSNAILQALVKGGEGWAKGIVKKNKDGTYQFEDFKKFNPDSGGKGRKPPVDTSPAVSPAEQAWRGQPGHLKTMYDQWWRLLGGPQFNPYQASLNVQSFEDLHKKPYDDDYSLKPGKNKGFSGPAVQSPPVGGMSGIGASRDVNAAPEQYAQPDHGVLGNPDPPGDETVVVHAGK